MARVAKRAKGLVKTAPPIDVVSVDEAVNMHRGEWIIMRVRKFDEKSIPSEGEVIAHSPSDSRIWDTLSRLLQSPQLQDARFYLFWGEPAGRSGAELRAALKEEAARQEAERARW